VVASRPALKASPSKQRVAGFKPVPAASNHDGAEIDDVYENAPCGFHSLDADGLFIRINNTLSRWLGYRREDVVGKINFRDFLTRTSLELFEADFRNAGKPDFIADETYEMRRKDGSILNVLLNTVTVRDADGRAVMTRSAALNIEARKQADRRVMELLDLNTKIVARAPVGIIVYAASGECVLANPGSAAIVGGTPEDIMLHPFTELRFWRETGLLQAAKDALATGTTRNENVHVATAEGRDLWLDCDLVPFTTDGAARLLYIMTDVTDRRQAEIELGEATRVAELASQVKSEFLANMSHEIRTPMTAIMGFTSLLEEAPLESRERDYVAKIKMSAASLLGILNDVLDFSKIEAGRLELEHTPFSLQDVMRSIAVIVGANAAGKNLEVVYDMAADVPDRLTGDPLRLQQILLNLAGNAVKFTSVGEVVLAVRKVADPSAQTGAPQAGQAQVKLEFLIRDTGVGIEPKARDRLFQAFSQADASTTRKFGGTGLGLAISSKLAALMGGRSPSPASSVAAANSASPRRSAKPRKWWRTRTGFSTVWKGWKCWWWTTTTPPGKSWCGPVKVSVGAFRSPRRAQRGLTRCVAPPPCRDRWMFCCSTGACPKWTGWRCCGRPKTIPPSKRRRSCLWSRSATPGRSAGKSAAYALIGFWRNPPRLPPSSTRWRSCVPAEPRRRAG
jgi:PAS domain S-box-containing protein